MATAEFLSYKWKYKPITVLKHETKLLLKKLQGKPQLSMNRLFETELLTILKLKSNFNIAFYEKDKPVLGTAISRLEKITDKTVTDLLLEFMQSVYISNMELSLLRYAAEFVIIKDAIENNQETAIPRVYELLSLDYFFIGNAVNPLHKAFLCDKIYCNSSEDTKRLYRDKLSEICVSTDIPEERLSFEVVTRSEKDGVDIGTMIFRDYRRVFPYSNVSAYIALLLYFTIGISIIASFFINIYLLPLVLFPIAAIVKPLCDFFTSRYAHAGEMLPRLSEDCGKNGSIALVALSTLIASESDIDNAIAKIKLIGIKNPNCNFCILADLPSSKTEVDMVNDKRLLHYIRKAFTLPNCIFIVRKRKYSKTQKTFQGAERKRGAIGDLVRFIKGEKVQFTACFGNTEKITTYKYLVTLDYDTVPFMNSIDTLVAIAEHPLNKRFGIIAPRITSSLSSSLKTTFSRVMAGNGGCSSVSSYDSFAGEFYNDAFGSGIFTGKGLVRVDEFYNKCLNFPEERILSHDILEGGLLGVAFAGDVEFSDNFPSTSKAFFKRLERWIRGDMQNVKYCTDKRFSKLTHLELFDNIRRAVTPIVTFGCFFMSVTIGEPLLAVIATISVMFPYILSLLPSLMNCGRLGVTRQFYSPLIPETKLFLTEAFTELLLLPKNAVVSFTAISKAIFRRNISHKNMLQWTTASVFDHTGNVYFSHLIAAEVLSLLLLIMSILYSNFYTAVASVFFICMMPELLFLDRKTVQPSAEMPPNSVAELKIEASKMWNFYADYVTADTNFLPPDNVQYAPVFRVCRRTSPTNIGFYLLSTVCAEKLQLITAATMEERIAKTVATLEKMEKWNGNLYNWYNIDNLSIVSTFVSTVDSGNFVTALVAVNEGLKRLHCSETLINAVQQLISGTKLYHFYSDVRNLFSIGFDTATKSFSTHFYDLYMSEARLTSYFAISSGQVPKKHWNALSRTMSKDGNHAGAVSWSGTCFEFFMPELLLSSKEGSLAYESLRYALHMQKKRARQLSLPFGTSESGYFAFDYDLNYQYKAHGIQRLGLKYGLDNEYVVSPYSSFLMLEMDFGTAYNNLARLPKQASHKRYGFFEAIDYTYKRTASSMAIVQSHMAHHVGMSMAGITNTIANGYLKELFLNNATMQRGTELLEEKTMTNEKILSYKHFTPVKEKATNGIVIDKIVPSCPKVNLLSNGRLTLLYSDNGSCSGFYNGKSTIWKTTDYVRFPRGAFFATKTSEKELLPFFHNVYSPNKYTSSITFSPKSVEYYVNYKTLATGVETFIDDGTPTELRRFVYDSTSSEQLNLKLCGYIEPALAKFSDITAHPAFMDMFLKISYRSKENLFLASRKERTTDSATYMCVGFTDSNIQFNYSLSREDVQTPNGTVLSVFDKKLQKNNDANVPSPCIYFEAAVTVPANGSSSVTLFICYGDSKEDVLKLAASLRLRKLAVNAEIVVSPLPMDTVAGRLCGQLLPNIVTNKLTDGNIRQKNTLGTRALWRFAISGDLPIVVYDTEKGSSKAQALLQMKQNLTLCGIPIDLIFLCNTNAEKQSLERLLTSKEAFVLVKMVLSPDIKALIKAVAVYTFFDGEAIETPKNDSGNYVTIIKAESNAPEKGKFDGDSYVCPQNAPPFWSNVLANAGFGTLVGVNSLGFTFARHSNENRLTPWLNDLARGNAGEMVVVNLKNKFFDIINGATMCPNRVTYNAILDKIKSETTVFLPKKGSAKIIDITFQNPTEKEVAIAVAYYVKPIMGTENRLIKIRAEDGCLMAENPQNYSVPGVMCISSDKKAIFATSENDFFEGNWQENTATLDCMATVVILRIPANGSESVRFILSFTANKKDPLSVQRAVLDNMPSMTKNPVNTISVATPSETMNALFNYWLPWQSYGARLKARTGFFQNGGAYGFRDQLQDTLSVMYLKPYECKWQIYRACSSQFIEGDVLHWWHNFRDGKKGVRTRYSDDLLWLPYVAAEFYSFSGDVDFLKKEIAYIDGDKLKSSEDERYLEVAISKTKESVYAHCKKSLEKGYNLGANNLLKMGGGDWNDSYNNVGIKGSGESVWLTMFYILTVKKFMPLCAIFEDYLYAETLAVRIKLLETATEDKAWDGWHYKRAFYDDGSSMGSLSNDACKIDLLPQAFATLCGLPNLDKRKTALESAKSHLIDSENGIVKLFTPAFAKEKTLQRPGYVMEYPEGMRENGGQYTHAALWLVKALYKEGQNDLAFSVLQMLSPANKDVDVYKNEPYYISADVYTNSAAFGRAGWSIYTGAASWYYKTILEDLLGFTVKGDEITVNPHLPAIWKEVTVKVTLNGIKREFHIKNS